MVLCAVLASVMAVLAFSANSAQGAARLPPNFARSQVVGGLASPTAMEFAPDGRLFVAEQRGPLGVAFDPAFTNNHYVYLYYTQRATGTTPAHNRVIRVTARGDRAVAGSKKL